MDVDLTEFLPKLTRNKNYVKKKKYLKRKRKAELERERLIDNRLNGGKKKVKKSRKEVPDGRKKKPPTRKPKTTVSGVKTGKETLSKKKAKMLVQEAKMEKKKKKKATTTPPSSMKENDGKKTSGKFSNPKDVKEKAKRPRGGKERNPPQEPKTEGLSSSSSFVLHRGEVQQDENEDPKGLLPGLAALDSPLANEALDRLLIAQTIRGRDFFARETGEEGSLARARHFVREDPALYPPDIAFCEDLAVQKESEDVNEDTLLDNAHRYFKELGAKEEKVKQAAAAYLKKMREINRRGGDKDGFRYVLPSGVKQMAQQMMLASSANTNNNGNSSNKKEPFSLLSSFTMGDSTTLDSTFNGDGIRLSEKRPMRSRRRRPSTFSDFYKFQVSKRWTQNAENFLNRGRASKALFEAKKKQRSIRKL